MQRTNLSLHVHPTGHSFADDDDVNPHKKCSTTIHTNNIFDVMFLVGMHILITQQQYQMQYACVYTIKLRFNDLESRAINCRFAEEFSY